MFLAAHADLNVCGAARDGKEIVLLGYLLNPGKPEADDEEIVRGLLEAFDRCRSLDELFPHTYSLSGRWILIVADDTEARLFNDAAGYRQVHYCSTASGEVWCASQPGMLADLLGLAEDRAARAFIDACSARDPQYWWPGDTSLYREAVHLQANHYLDLRTGHAQRYWPRTDLVRLPFEQVVAENAALLRGLLRGAARRYDLALPLTAGRDTRLLLAASRDVVETLYIFTLMYWDLTPASADVRVPTRLLARLGLPHHVIPCPPEMDGEFEAIYARNVPTARRVYGAIAQGLYHGYPERKVSMKGNAIPIGKGHYRRRLREQSAEPDPKITPETLSGLARKEGSFALAAYERWLAGITDTNVDVLDLFWWEEREGNWQAMSQLEWDIVQETFVPYNCRTFLTNLLAVPERYRGPPYMLHDAMIRRLWPEVLAEPINPHRTDSLAVKAKKLLQRARRRARRLLR